MAKQTLNNNEARGVFRTKLNDMFTEIYNYITSIGTSITNNTNDIININTSLTTINSTLSSNATTLATHTSDIASLNNVGVTSVGVSTALASTSITTTPTKLTFFDTVVLQAGIVTTASIPAQTITVGATGYYKIYGTVIAAYPQTDALSLRLYKNSSPLTPNFAQQGLGTGKPTNITYSTIVYLTAGDVLSLYASATSTISVVVDGASVNIEKTKY